MIENNQAVILLLPHGAARYDTKYRGRNEEYAKKNAKAWYAYANGALGYLVLHGKIASLAWVETQSGPQSAPTWTAVCKIDGVERGKGTGAQKLIAKDNAADQALAALKSEAGEQEDINKTLAALRKMLHEIL